MACRGASGSEDSNSPGEHSGEKGGEEESPTMDEIVRPLASYLKILVLTLVLLLVSSTCFKTPHYGSSPHQAKSLIHDFLNPK